MRLYVTVIGLVSVLWHYFMNLKALIYSGSFFTVLMLFTFVCSNSSHAKKNSQKIKIGDVSSVIIDAENTYISRGSLDDILFTDRQIDELRNLQKKNRRNWNFSIDFSQMKTLPEQLLEWIDESELLTEKNKVIGFEQIEKRVSAAIRNHNVLADDENDFKEQKSKIVNT